MYKKPILLGLASALLLFSILGTLSVTPIVADPKTIRVPEDYSTIQAAVDAADHGDTIQVASGTYYENLEVYKSVKLVGEGSNTTIIDGNGNDTVVYVTADNVHISDFTIRNGMSTCGEGIVGLFDGVWFYESSGSTVNGNVLSHNFAGVSISRSDNIVVSGNLIMDNQYGVRIVSSSGNVIRDNAVTSSWLYGINLFASDNNTIVENEIVYNLLSYNTYGICIGPCSSGNTLYHNNLIDNTNQAYENKTNTWDNGAEGNYWSDYMGEDLNGDGVGDTLLPHQGVDYCPLMEPWGRIRIFDGITTFSNTTVVGFSFDPSLMQISFKVFCPVGAVGFCNVTIPKILLGGVFIVLIDGAPIDYILSRNATHSSLYFTYSHGFHSIEILDIFGVLVKSWYKGVEDYGYDERAELSGDGFIDGIDLVILALNWYKA